LTPMGFVKGVDKGVKTLTSSTVGDKRSVQGNGCLLASTGRLGSLDGLSGLELGSVSVESKIPVGGVMWVNEGVAVGVRFLDRCGGTGGQWNTCAGCGGGGNTSGCLRCGGRCGSVFTGNFRIKGSGILTGGLNMISFQDFESIYSSGIFNGNNFSVIANVGILANSVSVNIGFFTENMAIFCCKSRAGSAISGIKTLFF